MNLSEHDFEWAASEGIISPEASKALWHAFQSRPGVQPRFDLANVAYYLGAMIVIAAMAWLMTNGWDRFGGFGIAALALTYATCFILVGYFLWNSIRLEIPGGLLYTMAVCMTPLFVYGIERGLGLWPQGNPGKYNEYYVWIRGSWILLEVCTIIAGGVALYFVQFPFMTAPVAFSCWFLSMDIAPLILHTNDLTASQREWTSLGVGAFVLLLAYLVDRRTKEDYAYWLYIFGTLSFWGGLSLMESNNEWGKFAYCLINIAFMIVSIFLARPVFLIFGSLGFFGYLAYLSHRVFMDSMMFPFVLTLLGLGTIFLGVKYQRNKDTIESVALSIVPVKFKWLIPKER